MDVKPSWSAAYFLVFGSIVFCVFLFLAGFLLGHGNSWNILGKTNSARNMPERARTLQDKQNAFFFVRPLLELEDDPELRLLSGLETSIDRYVSDQKRGGALENTSVYVRDLSNGVWGGVREDDEYIPASMSKVVLMIALLRQAMSDDRFFVKKVVYDGTGSAEIRNTSNTSPDPLVMGEPYTIDDLVRRMIMYSDNDATATLQREVNNLILQDVFTDLSVIQKAVPGAETRISPHQYSFFFRVLFNASYLPWSISEQALQLLSKTTYHEGLVAGVPKEITLSHKFGHREEADNSTHFLHDCGIVYAPQRPYFVCVMTRGVNIDVLTETIQHISGMVYEEMTKGVTQR